MYRFVLRPKWIAFHLLVVVMVFVMVNLAFWQLHRLQDKREFNDEVRTRTAMAVAPFDEVVTDELTVDDADQVEWRPVELQGRYLADEQVVVVNRAQQGVVGENVVTPMQLDDRSVVLVNRGFVAATDPVPAPPEGVVTVVGRVRATQPRGFGGLTDPAEGDLTEVQRIDIERLAQQLPAPVAPVYVDLLTSRPTTADAPIPLPDPELDEGPHLSYMIQWFIFSICAIAGWVLAIRRSARKQLTPAGERTPPDSPPPAVDEPTTAPS
jgi:cytochrome oxidase assembly protein ShyY1